MSDELPPLPDDIAALLQTERSAPGPSPEAASRLLSRVSASVDIGDPGDTSGAPPDAGGEGGPAIGGTDLAGAGASAAATKTIVALAFVGGIGVGGTAVHLLTPTPEPLIVTVPAPAPEPTPAPAPAPTPEPPKPETQTKSKKKRRPKTRSSEEVALIDRARTALGRGRPGDALLALRQHKRKFRRGALVEEREALMCLALLGAGEEAEAKRRARAFQKRYPKSLFRPLIEQNFPE